MYCPFLSLPNKTKNAFKYSLLEKLLKDIKQSISHKSTHLKQIFMTLQDLDSLNNLFSCFFYK